MDYHDGSVRLATGNTVLLLNASGTVLRSLTTTGDVKAIAFDSVSSKLWVGTSKSLVAYDAFFTAINSIALGKKEELRALDVDANSGKLWVVLKKSVRQFSPAGAPLSSTALEKARAVSADGNGAAWVATEKTL